MLSSLICYNITNPLPPGARMTTLTKKIDEVKTIIRYRKIGTTWQRKHDPNVPKVGEMATDFTLTDTSGEHTITLSDFIGKQPVALVFGSFT